VTPLPWFAGTLVLGLAYRYLIRRRKGRRIRLPDGRTLELVSAIALRSGPAWHLLALEYVSTEPSADPAALGREAHGVLLAAAARPEFAQCREASVTAHLSGADRGAVARRTHVFGFHRPDASAAWEPAPIAG
jgi:hypothetical protein